MTASSEVPPGFVLAHRGLHSSGSVENSGEAITGALDAGLGIETDLRSANGSLVIAHDLPYYSDLTFTWLWKLIAGDKSDTGALVALNIKEDGLIGPLLEHITDVSALADNVFFFDMSIPQLLAFARAGLPIAVRLSEYEPPAVLKCFEAIPYQHLWIDGFHGDWYLNDTTVDSWCERRTGIVVSPEIHGRDPRWVWDWIVESRSRGAMLAICTDRPIEFLEWSRR